MLSGFIATSASFLHVVDVVHLLARSTMDFFGATTYLK